MKKLLLLFAFLPLFFYAQEDLPMVAGVITFSKVIDVSGKSKNESFDKSLEFASKYLRDSNDEIRLKDKDLGKIVIKSSERYWNGVLTELITIENKDGRSRISVSNMGFTHDNYPTQFFNVENFPKAWMGKKAFYKNLPGVAERIILDYEKYLTSTKKDDW